MKAAPTIVFALAVAGCSAADPAASTDASNIIPLDAVSDRPGSNDARIPTLDGSAEDGARGCGEARFEDGSGEAIVCDCTVETALDATGSPEALVTFGNKYAPRCLLVSAGTTVTWQGNFLAHPLWPSACAGDVAENPIHDVPDPSDTSLDITFPLAGTFPYYCPYHASDSRSQGGMCGVVYVVP